MASAVLNEDSLELVEDVVDFSVGPAEGTGLCAGTGAVGLCGVWLSGKLGRGMVLFSGVDADVLKKSNVRGRSIMSVVINFNSTPLRITFVFPHIPQPPHILHISSISRSLVSHKLHSLPN